MVFMGRLVDTRTYTQDSRFGDDTPFADFKFEVEAVWKGSVPQIAYISAIVGYDVTCADLPYSAELIVGVRYHRIHTMRSMEFNFCSVVFRD